MARIVMSLIWGRYTQPCFTVQPKPLTGELDRMKRVLFICSRNRLRSPTAERVFATVPGIETDSAGLAPDADCPLSADQLLWADIIFVMEKRHRTQLAQKFKRQLAGKKLVCLDIKDDYQLMQPELVLLLEKRVLAHLK